MNMITPFLQFIQNYGNALIIVLGMTILILLIVNGVHLLNRKSRIEEALFSRERKYFKDALSKELSEEEDENTKATPDKIRSLATAFNATCSWHDVLAQIISIFPLLGILGTVAGLILQVNAGDIATMLGSLDTALGTTFWGLVFAILLKVLDTLFPSKVINTVEVMLDDFDKKMSLAEMFQSIREDNKA